MSINKEISEFLINHYSNLKFEDLCNDTFLSTPYINSFPEEVSNYANNLKSLGIIGMLHDDGYYKIVLEVLKRNPNHIKGAINLYLANKNYIIEENEEIIKEYKIFSERLCRDLIYDSYTNHLAYH